MKHYFIMNPIAGAYDQTKELSVEIAQVFQELDIKDAYEIFITTRVNEAEEYTRRISNNLKEEAIFYACGGDGTCFEVLNGIAGNKKCILSIIPIGSCNDFLKTFPNCDFRDLKKLITGKIKEIDILQVNNRYCLNVLNIGYDARTNDDCNRIKSRTKKVSQAYRRAIILNLLKKFKRPITLETNNETFYNGKYLLMTCANGKYYGGGFHCAPRAEVDDGLMEVMVIKGVSRFTFIRLISKYKEGKMFDHKELQKLYAYTRTNQLTITSNETMCVCLDGEIFYWDKINVNMLEHFQKMLMPR